MVGFHGWFETRAPLEAARDIALGLFKSYGASKTMSGIPPSFLRPVERNSMAAASAAVIYPEFEFWTTSFKQFKVGLLRRDAMWAARVYDHDDRRIVWLWGTVQAGSQDPIQKTLREVPAQSVRLGTRLSETRPPDALAR